jgi:adenosine deaminase
MTARMNRASDVECRVILCTLRHFSEEQSMQTVRLVEAFKGSTVVALDIAGDEARYPLAPHVAAYRYAVEHDLYRTAHAGEAAGAQSVWETLRELRPLRVGHGVRSVEDPELVEYLHREQIQLEVCPSSNVQTNMYETLADHPLPRLYGADVPVGINCDCRTISDITLTDEYQRVHDTFGWTEEQFLRCNLTALANAFISDAERQPLRERLLNGYPTQQPVL